MQEVTSSNLVFSTSIRDKSEPNEDKSRKIKVLRDFVSISTTSESLEKAPFGQVALLKPLLKRLWDFSNDLRHKSLICRLLSLQCLFINQLLTGSLPTAIVTEIARREQNERYYEQKHIHDSFLCPKESSKQNGKGGHYDPRLGQWRIRTIQLEAGHRAAAVGCDESKDDRHDESRTRVQRAARRHSDESAQPLSGDREIRSLCNGGESTQCLFRDYRSPTTASA